MSDESLDNLATAFNGWRRKKGSAAERIPKELVARAQRLASVHGVGPVVHKTGISRTHLSNSKRAVKPAATPTPTFSRVEIRAPSRSAEPLVEVETAGGLKFRAFAITAETVGLLSSFCRAEGGYDPNSR